MKVFITGATGFIGERLTQHLAGQGVRVNALVRNPDKSRNISRHEVTMISGDIGDIESLRKGMADCDSVYHLAGMTQPWHRDKTIYSRINVEGTRNVLQAASDQSVRKLVFTSTAGVFGPADGDNRNALTEYDRTKAQAEELVRSWDKGNVERVIVNPTRVYGPGQLSVSNTVTKLINRYRLGKWRFVPGDGTQLGNYVLIDDVVRGHVLAMERGRHGERYILGGENRSYRELFDTVAELTGKRYKLFGVPLWMMMAVARMQLMLTAVGRTPAITPAFARRYHHDWNFNSDKAQRELGYTLTPLKQGVGITLEWLERQRER